MKKSVYLLVIMSVVCIAITAFNQEEKQPRNIIKERFAQRHEAYLEALSLLKIAAERLENNAASVEALKSQYLATRAAFKQWEYLAEYLDPMLVRDNINGSPLPKLERNSFGPNVLDPTGMQVIDELIFSEHPSEEKNTIIQEVEKLRKNVAQFIPGELLDRQIFEAIRLELVRIFTLGLTGFDVPASGNSIPDAITAVKTLQQDFSLYFAAIAKENPHLSNRIQTLYAECHTYLSTHKDFEQSDRLHVLKKYINPLFENIQTAHELLGIELLHEVAADHLLPPFNHLSKNIFANDFLDPSRYMKLPAALHSGQLITLGRTLFFDPVLSISNERSCASCHHPGKAFTDGLPKSLAMGKEGTVERNAPTLINAVYSDRFFYDMRADALEDQIEHVIVSKKEFATEVFEITSKLSRNEEYSRMFDECFQLLPGNINKQTISYAIAAYVASLRGFNSVFDKYVRNEIADIPLSVKRGFNLFMGKAACGTCHFAPVFNGLVPPLYTENESEVLGVPQNPYVKNPALDPDPGRSKAKLKEDVPFYLYSFKTPTVRNAELTAPYMHNGAYKTLNDVMDFYNKGGGNGIGIRLEHQTLPFDKLNLTRQEIRDIIAFMNALTDTTGMTAVPTRLPQFATEAEWNNRKIGGVY